MTQRFIEQARAKLNLSLTILGRRPDGYHELESLVAFARISDTLELTLTDGQSASCSSPPLTISGPFASALSVPGRRDPNLVTRALARVETELNDRLPVTLHLIKRLPLASGIGGGSADAAATLRLLSRAFPDLTAKLDFPAIALALGADVPVCLTGKSAWMTGIGDHVTPVDVPSLDIIVANPQTDVPADKTRQVFRVLSAPSMDLPKPRSAPPIELTSRARLLEFMRQRGNDLSSAARLLVPAVADIETALRDCSGCELVTLSGAGPTVIGVFQDAANAAAAAANLKARHPKWWIAATSTG